MHIIESAKSNQHAQKNDRLSSMNRGQVSVQSISPTVSRFITCSQDALILNGSVYETLTRNELNIHTPSWSQPTIDLKSMYHHHHHHHHTCLPFYAHNCCFHSFACHFHIWTRDTVARFVSDTSSCTNIHPTIDEATVIHRTAWICLEQP